MLVHLNRLEGELASLQEALQAKEKEFAGIVRLGRTELQDALPMTVGMQFSAWAEAIARDRWRIFKARERIKALNLGGTAIGTGFNAPRRYIFLVLEKLKEITRLGVTRAENMLEATQNLDAVVEVSGLMKTLAVNLLKIAEDIRLLSSGPAGGIGELKLEPLQEGSSIMPGKCQPGDARVREPGRPPGHGQRSGHHPRGRTRQPRAQPVLPLVANATLMLRTSPCCPGQ